MSTIKRSLYLRWPVLILAAFIIYAILTFVKLHDPAGIVLALSFFLLAIALRQSKGYKGYWYSAMILGVVSLAMYFPLLFTHIGGKDSSVFIPFLLQAIMFGMGTELSLKDFAQVMERPKAVIVGIVCHYSIMPLVGVSLAHLFNFPPEIAAGIILVGCCPSGLASNVMCYLSKGNLALSVSVTTISTLLAPFLTPLLMKLLAGSYVQVSLAAMIWDMTKIVIAPIVAGLLVHYIFRGKVSWLNKAMPVISMAGIGLVLLVITSAGRDNLLKVGFLLAIATLIHNVTGYALAYWSGRALRFPEEDCRTIAFEVGMQNAGLAAALAKGMGKIATVGLAAVLFGTVMNITGSSLATWWSTRKPVLSDAT